MQTNGSERFHGQRRPSSFGEQGGSRVKLHWQLVAVIAEGLGSSWEVWGCVMGSEANTKHWGNASKNADGTLGFFRPFSL